MPTDDRMTRWLWGYSDSEIAAREAVSVSAVCQWRQRRSLAPNRPAARPSDPAAVRRATATFRGIRLHCEALGIPREQLDAMEPWARDLPDPDPTPDLTPTQRAALMALADAHDDALRAWSNA